MTSDWQTRWIILQVGWQDLMQNFIASSDYRGLIANEEKKWPSTSCDCKCSFPFDHLNAKWSKYILSPLNYRQKDTDDKTIPRKYEVLFLLFPFCADPQWFKQVWTSIHILSWWWFTMFHWIGTNLAGTSYAYDHALVHTKLGSFKIRWPDDHGSSVMQYRQKKSFWICICLVDHSKWS